MWSGERAHPNCHLEAGVFINHTGSADFEEEPGNCSLGDSAPFYKGRAVLDQNFVKSSVPCTGLHFSNLFPLSPLCGTGEWDILWFLIHTQLLTLMMYLALRYKNY